MIWPPFCVLEKKRIKIKIKIKFEPLITVWSSSGNKLNMNMFLKEINMINSRRINHIAQEEITQKHLVYIETSTAILSTSSVHSVLSY